MDTHQYNRNLKKIFGKTIAIVYIFEGEDAAGFGHYHIWNSTVISQWMLAVQSLRCMPLLLDVRTFVHKAVNRTLPQIDYVLNLNCGSTELSPMALVPSTCAFIGIPCIPCDSVAILTGENKIVSNHIAAALQMNVPKSMQANEPSGITRPLNFGSSYGVSRDYHKEHASKGLYQEFIKGFDITTPLVYNPIAKQMDAFPTVLNMPTNGSPEWFFGEKEKESWSGFEPVYITKLSEELLLKYRTLTAAFSIGTFCRIDARIKCESKNELDEILAKPLAAEKVFFIEINPMPTVRLGNQFDDAYKMIDSGNPFFPILNLHMQLIQNSSLHSFLLACAIMAIS